MKAKTPKSGPVVTPEDQDSATLSIKPLTVNVPVEVLNLAKTRASLEGTTLSAIVTAALTPYAAGLKDVIARLGLGASK
ncbi:MAG: hypothetical protein ABSF69_27750 [Polyangiaceae bacterium]|jgi:hypothetical protein